MEVIFYTLSIYESFQLAFIYLKIRTRRMDGCYEYVHDWSSRE
jgi:hypothetical protein